MSIQSRSHQYGTVFENWQILELIGQGSGGKTAVFRLKRIDSNRGQSALKVINLIEERGDYDSMPAQLRKEYETAREECKGSALQEVWLMDDFQGNTNIVDYLDHKFVDWTDGDGFGCDMLIRMELLKDLRGEIRSGKQHSQEEVIKIGCDICQALILCHENGILHRDIKPENIFVNRNGNYKLGDFGISKIVSTTPMSMASTGIGTPEYAAPEQTSGKYDKRVDIYSLGLVLYELTNHYHLPFSKSSYVRPDDVNMRMAGIPLPPPSNASSELSNIILKACAFKPEDRYQSADEFLLALKELQKDVHSHVNVSEIASSKADIPNVLVSSEQNNVEATIGHNSLPRKHDTIPANWDLRDLRIGEYETVPAEPSLPVEPYLLDEAIPSYETLPAAEDVPKAKLSHGSQSPKAKPIQDNTSRQKSVTKKTGNAQPQFRYFGNKRAKKCFPGLVPPIIQIPGKTDIILSESFRRITNGFIEDVDEVIVPDGVLEIQSNAFDFIVIKKYISLPDTLTKIGENAFTLADGAYVKCSEGTAAYMYCQKYGIKNTVDMNIWKKHRRCQHCGGALSILFQKCRKCGRAKDY